MNNVTDLPSRLYTPPSSIVNPPASTSKQELPFNELAWEDFEKLCLRLASKNSDIEQCRLYGNRGESQEGIDIFGRKSGSSKYAVFQCKRVKRFGPAKIREAVNLFLNGDWKDRSDTFCLCTQVSLQSVANSKELTAQIERSLKENISLVAWDSHRMAILLKEHPDLVYDFFGMEWLKRFSGEAAAQAFSNRMCPQDVKVFRQKLGDFYKHVFNEQDTGILLSQIPGRRPLPIEDRFVVPDIVENRSVPDGDSHGEVASNDVRNGYGYEFSVRSQSPFDESGKQRRNQSARMIEERIPVEQWLCNSGNCVLLGEPGAGKSTLLRFLAIDLLRDTPYFQKASKRWGSHLPVWIPFALWTKLVSDTPATSSLTDVLRHWLQGFNELRMMPLVEAAIKDDRLLLLVDGLDEWDGIDSAEIALSRLKVFAEQRSTPVVATSRPLGFQQLPVPSGSWRIGKIAEFNLCQQSHLANIWFSHWHQNGDGSSDEGKINHETTSFISELEQNADLQQLAGIPLLLLLLIYHRLQEASLPEDRFKAYESMIDHLISTRPRKRRVAAGVAEVVNVLTADEFRTACANLAFTIQCSEGAGSISRADAQDVLIKHAEDEELGLGMCRTDARRVGQQLLDLAEGNLGLVVRRSSSDVGFFHRTFHEYLAACHLTRLPMSKQQELLAAHCTNSQWTETILCLFHMTHRTDEVESLVHAIEKAKRSASSLGRNNIEALLTEIAFGHVSCSPRLAKKLAAETFAVIERGDWMPQRKRLLRRVIRGLKSTSLRPLIEQKVTQWIPGRLKWRANLYEAIAKWSPSNEVDDCLWNGVHEETFFFQQAAAQSLCHVRNGDPEVGDRFAEFSIKHPRVSIRKVALQALLYHWPNHPRLVTAIDQAGQSLDPDLQALAISSRIERLAQTDQDKAALLELGRGNSRFTDLSYLVVESLVKGWPSDRKIKEACLSAVRQEFPHQNQLDRTVATQVLVLGFPNDPDIAEYFAECVENSDHPFVFFSLTTGFASVLQRLQQTSNEHRRLRNAVDTWLEKCTINGPDELQAARFTKSDRAKTKLLSLLDHSWRFWAAKGLIELWPEDEAVVTRLREMMLGENKTAATLAVQMRHVIRDRQQCHVRLMELLRDKSVGRKDLVLHAILDLGLELIDVDIVDEVFDQILIGDTTQSRDIGAIGAKRHSVDCWS